MRFKNFILLGCILIIVNPLKSQVQKCENLIYCQIDSLLNSFDTSYSKNAKQEVIIVFVVSYKENFEGEIEKILKSEGINIDLNCLKNLCSKINFSCGNIFPRTSEVIFYFARSNIVNLCKP